MPRRLLHDVQPCGDDETWEHADYLADTPRADLAAALRAGTHRLSRAVIRSRGALGEVSTCWEELGGLVARDLVGRERFLVREAFPVLMAPEGRDERGREAVLMNMAQWNPHGDPALPTLLYEDGFTVLDWNKRTVAFYQRTGGTAAEGDAVAYPVYVVHRAGVAVPLDLEEDPPPKAEQVSLRRGQGSARAAGDPGPRGAPPAARR